MASPLLARVVNVHLTLGQQVVRGDILIELDSEAEELLMRRERTRAEGLQAKLAHLNAQIAAERAVSTEEEAEAQLGATEAKGLVREAEVAARVADQELSRLGQLKEAGLSPGRDLEKGQAEAELRRLSVDRLGIAAERVPQQQATRARESMVRIDRLQTDVATLDADRATLDIEVARLSYEIERRKIRAPIDGRVGEAAMIYEGYVVTEGEKLCSIVPVGDYLVVAQYPPEAAFGRIRAGQKARLRLEGFPWAEFGSVSTRVTRVAEEVRDGTVRVESRLDVGSSFRGKLEHGMPGSLEVTLERLSPLELSLRNAGQWLTTNP
ncbi:MAG: HlyD family efflux transporter periplasmic adaptor subunit [Polyangiaceae bacterium]